MKTFVFCVVVTALTGGVVVFNAYAMPVLGKHGMPEAAQVWWSVASGFLTAYGASKFAGELIRTYESDAGQDRDCDQDEPYQ